MYCLSDTVMLICKYKLCIKKKKIAYSINLRMILEKPRQWPMFLSSWNFKTRRAIHLWFDTFSRITLHCFMCELFGLICHMLIIFAICIRKWVIKRSGKFIKWLLQTKRHQTQQKIARKDGNNILFVHCKYIDALQVWYRIKLSGILCQTYW